MTPRVLLVDLAPTTGGSIVSLRLLVEGLLNGPYSPIVLLASGSPHVSTFRRLPVQVLTMDAQQGRGNTYSAPIDTIRSSDFAAWARHAPAISSIWHGVGFSTRILRRHLPEARRIARMASLHGAQLIHCNDAVAISRSSILAARLARLPCVCHARNFDDLGRFDHWLADSVDSFIFNSAATERAFLQQRAGRDRHRVIYNALDLAQFAASADGNSVRKELGLRVDIPVIGVTGRLVPWKGHDVYLHALARAVELGARLQGLVVGGPDPSHPNWLAHIRALAESLEIADAVHFVGHRDDVARMLAAMDVVVHTSTAPEPFGRVLIEAMAMSKPVVASSDGGVPEIVQEGQTGLMVSPGDVQAYAEAICSLLSHPDDAAAMGRAGRASVERRFSAATHVAQILDVYGDVLSDR